MVRKIDRLSHKTDYVSGEASLDVASFDSLDCACVWGVWSASLKSVVFASPLWSDCAYTMACAPDDVSKSLSIVRFDVSNDFLGRVRRARCFGGGRGLMDSIRNHKERMLKKCS